MKNFTERQKEILLQAGLRNKDSVKEWLAVNTQPTEIIGRVLYTELQNWVNSHDE